MTQAKKIPRLTDEEIEILNLSVEKQDVNILLDYFTRQEGQEHGWNLDFNFTPEGAWQKTMAMASQTFIVVIAGVSTGKTVSVGMSALVHGMLTPDFKFLNVAKIAWQSQLMWSAIKERVEGTPLMQEGREFLTFTSRPHPMIIIEFYAGTKKIRSTLEFLSLGEKEDATNIFSWRGDWINIEEAGLLNSLSTIVGNLSTRGTGSTPGNRPYMGRLSLISNPWENPDLWQLQDIAIADPEHCLAMNINTDANKNTTQQQVEQILRLLPPGMDPTRFLTGNRPEGRGTFFNKVKVSECESELLSVSLLKDKEVITTSVPHLGVFYYMNPRKDGHIYFILADPGTGMAPARNAPVIMVWDVTNVPEKPAFLSAFWWGNGAGSILPFNSQYMEWVKQYRPIFAGVDSTGTQKNTAEIMTLEYVYGKGLGIDEISGLDFSGPRKYSYLITARMAIESVALIWPSFCTGISTQLKNYDPKLDKDTSNLAQDIVSTIAMSAFSIRAFYGLFEEKEGIEAGATSVDPFQASRRNRTEDHGGRRSREATGFTRSVT